VSYSARREGPSAPFVGAGDAIGERATVKAYSLATALPRVPQRVEQYTPEGVDYGWVMQVTFVTTIVVGAPLVAVLSTQVALPTWEARAGFAIRVGAVVWLVSAVAVYLYARSKQ